MKFLKENKLEVITIASLVVLTFYQAFFNFFRADDWAWLYVAQLSAKDISHIFTLELSGFFRPFNHMLFQLWYSLFGLNPVGYNIVNILLHATNSVLVYYLALKFTKNKSASLVSASIFAVMSVHFESLLFISGGMSDNALLAFFLMLSFITFIKWCETSKIKYLGMSLLAFILNLFSYEGAVMLVPILFLYLVIFSKKITLKKIFLYIKTTIPYAIVLAPYVAYQYMIQVSGTVVKMGMFSIGWHFARNILDYSASIFTIFPLIGPEYLSRLNAPQFVYSIVTGSVIVASVLVTLVGLYIVVRGSKVSRFFLLWYLVIFAPFLFFTTHITSRYTYAPSIGIAIILGMLTVDVIKRLSEIIDYKLARTIVLAFVTVFIMFNIIAVNLIENYKYKINDDETMINFLKSNYPTFPNGSKLYFVNDTMPFRTFILEGVMSLYYPNSNYTLHEISRNQTSSIVTDSNTHIFDYIKTNYRSGTGVELR